MEPTEVQQLNADHVTENAIFRASLCEITGKIINEAYRIHGVVSVSQRIGEDIRKTAERLDDQNIILITK